MKVLFTGAAGQVGCRLVRQLMERNHEVRGAVLPDDPCQERIDGLDMEIFEGDLTDVNFVKRAVEKVDAVIHTANLVGPHFENNVQTNMEVARACADRADVLDRYIFVSSSAVFPNDGHWPSYAGSMPLYYAAHLDWFHRYLGGAPSPYDIKKMVQGRAFKK